MYVFVDGLEQIGEYQLPAVNFWWKICRVILLKPSVHHLGKSLNVP